MGLKLPCRVRVGPAAFWAVGAAGTATLLPGPNSELGAGEIVVEFDSPQADGDGDVYVAGFFPEAWLEPLDPI